MLIYEMPEDWNPNPTQFASIELEHQFESFMESATHQSYLFNDLNKIGLEVLSND